MIIPISQNMLTDVINLNLVHEIVHYGQHGDVIWPIQDIDKYIRE